MFGGGEEQQPEPRLPPPNNQYEIEQVIERKIKEAKMLEQYERRRAIQRRRDLSYDSTRFWKTNF